MHVAHQQSGLSLVESLMAMAIASITLGLAIPSMEDLRDRARLHNVAAQLQTDLHLARSSAIGLNQVVRITFSSDDAGTCYVVHTGGPTDCGCTTLGAARCQGDAKPLRYESVASRIGLQVQSNSRSVGFEPIRGMATPTATIAVRSRQGRQVNLVVNIMGRVRTCTPAPRGKLVEAC